MEGVSTIVNIRFVLLVIFIYLCSTGRPTLCNIVYTLKLSLHWKPLFVTVIQYLIFHITLFSQIMWTVS